MAIGISGTIPTTTAGLITLPPLTIPTNAAGNIATTAITLSNGANTITVPTWALSAIIIPSSSNAVAMTLKGVSGDTGIALALTTPSVISLASVSSFVITSTGAGATVTEIMFV